jgi:hypothetical protein
MRAYNVLAGASSAPPKAKKSKLSHTDEKHAHGDSTSNISSYRHSSSSGGSSSSMKASNRLIVVKEEPIAESEPAGTTMQLLYTIHFLIGSCPIVMVVDCVLVCVMIVMYIALMMYYQFHCFLSSQVAYNIVLLLL